MPPEHRGFTQWKRTSRTLNKKTLHQNSPQLNRERFIEDETRWRGKISAHVRTIGYTYEDDDYRGETTGWPWATGTRGGRKGACCFFGRGQKRARSSRRHESMTYPCAIRVNYQLQDTVQRRTNNVWGAKHYDILLPPYACNVPGYVCVCTCAHYQLWWTTWTMLCYRSVTGSVDHGSTTQFCSIPSRDSCFLGN